MNERDTPKALETFAQPERSTIVGGSALVAGLMLGAVVLEVSVDASLPLDERWIAGSLGGLVAFAALVTAHALLSLRGGLWLDGAGNRLGIGLTGRRDIWWIGLDRFSGLACERRQVTSDVADFAWRVVARFTNGVELVLMETHEQDVAEAVTEQLQAHTGLPALEEPFTPPARTSGETTIRVARGVAMHGPLFVAAFTLSVLGAALYSQLHVAPGFGLFVAPVLLFTGLALGLAVAVKRLATEHLVHRGGLWTHRFAFGPWHWGERTVSAPHPSWSLYIRPARGARIEIEGDDGTLVVAHGATTRSRASIEDLVRLSDAFDD